jgi:heme/copper-type cytochrome/quinol oxidase subunit 1
VLALLGLAAAAVVVVPDLIAGFLDQPAGEVNFDKYSSAVALNLITFAGEALFLIVVLAFGLMALRSFSRKGAPAGDDPWNGQTLEWATSSPPPFHNFDGDLVEVVSASPLLDREEL